MTTAIIENKILTVEVGTAVENAAGRTEKLLPSDWDRAAFRFPNPIPGWETKHAIACNVTVTGRTFQWRKGAFYVKARMEWVGDGEPSTFSEGWIFCNPFKLPNAN